MKKIFIAILLVSAISATSCKKESEVQPSEAKVLNVNDGGENLDKSNVGSWD